MQQRLRRSSLLKSLIAVIGGNLVYLYLKQWLPEPLKHRPFHLDWGILADFWICVALWGLLDLAHNFLLKSRQNR